MLADGTLKQPAMLRSRVSSQAVRRSFTYKKYVTYGD